MAFKQIFVLVVFAFVVDALKWKNCDGSSPVQISAINLSPEPVQIQTGATVAVSGKFRVTGAAGTQYKLRVKVYKSGWWGIWLPIPCPDKYCVHQIACDQMIALLEGEQCPLGQKEYVVKQQSLVLPDLPSALTLLIPNGKYKIRADLTDRASNRRISCVEAEVYIKT